MRPLREDLQATLDARDELGPDYDRVLADSFVERLEETIAARVRAELDAAPGRPARTKQGGGEIIKVALGSIGLGIPLTAIAVSNAGALGLVITWLAIAVVNVAAAAAIILRR
ncbi:hypothetical protein [Nonomuraea longicatena]